MKKFQKNYRRKLTTKTVTFYLYEQDLADFANSLNFYQFVKDALRKAMQGNNDISKYTRKREKRENNGKENLSN